MSKRKKRKKYIYIKVTDDEFELPVAVADTVHELADIVGVLPNSISKSMSLAKSGGRKTPYRKVEMR